MKDATENKMLSWIGWSYYLFHTPVKIFQVTKLRAVFFFKGTKLCVLLYKKENYLALVPCFFVVVVILFLFFYLFFFVVVVVGFFFVVVVFFHDKWAISTWRAFLLKNSKDVTYFNCRLISCQNFRKLSPGIYTANM